MSLFMWNVSCIFTLRDLLCSDICKHGLCPGSCQSRLSINRRDFEVGHCLKTWKPCLNLQFMSKPETILACLIQRLISLFFHVVGFRLVVLQMTFTYYKAFCCELLELPDTSGGCCCGLFNLRCFWCLPKWLLGWILTLLLVLSTHWFSRTWSAFLQFVSEHTWTLWIRVTLFLLAMFRCNIISYTPCI